MNAVIWVTLPVCYFHFRLFLSWISRGRVRCFCLGISEGSCINPFQEMGGPRLFSHKNSKIPRPTPANKKRTFPYTTISDYMLHRFEIHSELSRTALLGCPLAALCLRKATCWHPKKLNLIPRLLKKLLRNVLDSGKVIPLVLLVLLTINSTFGAP